MRVLIHRGQLAVLASLSAAAILWVWLLALQPIYTAAMGASTPLITWLRSVWSNSEDMGHGPFLPLVSLYVVYQRRRELASALGGTDWRGFVFTLFGLLIFWAGLKTEDVRICLLALVLWLWAVPFALYGAGVARQLVFPAGYLLLSVPVDSLLIFFTMKLRLLAAVMAVGIANGIGIATERIGTGLHSAVGGGFNLDVAEPCSGLRSIFAMTALAGAYAYFTQKTLLRQWLLFLCAVPVAVIGNIVRIVTITMVAAGFGEKTAAGFYHDYSGYIVFLVAILLLYELGRRISKWRLLDRGQKPPEVPAPVSTGAGARGRAAVLALTPAILLAGGLMVRYAPAVTPGSLAFLPARLPAEVGAWRGSPVVICHNEQCMRSFREDQLAGLGAAPLPREPAPAEAADEPWVALRDLKPLYACPSCQTGQLYAASLGEQRQLPPDTRILRSDYTDGRAVLTVTMVISGTGRNSIHRPELCLPAQGFVMKRIRVARAPGGQGEPIAVNQVDLERTQAAGVTRLEFVYWFFTDERQTASNVSRVLWTAWDRAFRNQATRWVMVTLTSPPGGASSEQMLAFSGELMTHLRKTL
jgi:exosortase